MEFSKIKKSLSIVLAGGLIVSSQVAPMVQLPLFTPEIQPVEATTSQQAKISKDIDAIFNQYYVKARRMGSNSRNWIGEESKEELSFATQNWGVVLMEVGRGNWDHNPTNARIVRDKVMQLYNSQVKGHILKGARKYYGNQKQASLYESIWRRHSSIYAFSTIAISYDRRPIASNIRIAEGVYPLIKKIHQEYFQIDYLYQMKLIASYEKGNLNAMDSLDAYLTALKGNLKTRRSFWDMLSGMGIDLAHADLTIPGVKDATLLYLLPNSSDYISRIKKDLEPTRKYYIAKLITRTAQALSNMEAKGMNVNVAPRRVLVELLPFVEGILSPDDVAIVRQASKKSSGGGRSRGGSGGSYADDIARNADDVRPSRNNRSNRSSSSTDDVDDVRSGRNSSRNNRNQNNPCVASVPGSGFIAIATDTPTMEFSNGGEVLVADAGLVVAGGEMLVAVTKDCFPRRFSDVDFDGTGYKNADDFYNKLIEGGEKSTNAFIRKNWDKATFNDAYKSAEYHLRKHGNGKTLRQFTSEAKYNYQKYSSLRKEVNIYPQRPEGSGSFGWKIDSPFGRGIYTKSGRILTFIKK